MAMVSISNGPRPFTKRDVIIQKFKIDGLVVNPHPRKKQFRNAIECFNVVIKQIIDGLIAGCCQATLPGPFDCLRRRRNDKKQKYCRAKAAEEFTLIIAIIANFETVKAKPVQQQMRKIVTAGLSRNITIQFAVNDF